VPSHSDEIHNYRMMRGDSVAMGAINAASTFLPVFVARLHGTAFEVGLLTAIPAVFAVLLAIPVGQVLQRRGNIVAWYSRGRLLAHLSYVAMAIVLLILPPGLAVPAVLVVWALAAIPSTIGIVSFPVVMDGAAGPRGRLELMSRRWSIMGVTTAIVVALVGVILDRLPFVPGYALVFTAFTVFGVISWWYSSHYRVASHAPDDAAHESLWARIRGMVDIVRAHPAFLSYSARQLVYVAGVRLTLPLIPLYFVRELQAPDAWIGIIATSQSLSLLVGYLFWRRQARVRGRAFMLLATLLVSSLYPVAISLTGSVLVVAVLAAAASLFSAGVDLALFDELMDRIPRQYGVTFTALDTTFANAATIVAPLLGAAIAETIGIHDALRFGSVITLLSVVLFAWDIRKRRRGALQAALRLSADAPITPARSPDGRPRRP
jgi:MFS family permease